MGPTADSMLPVAVNMFHSFMTDDLAALEIHRKEFYHKVDLGSVSIGRGRPLLHRRQQFSACLRPLSHVLVRNTGLTQDLRRTANGLQLHVDLVSSRWSMITVQRLTHSQVIAHASGNYVSSTRWVPQGSHAVEVVSSGCFRSRSSLSMSTDAIHNPSGYKGLAVIQRSWTLEGNLVLHALGSLKITVSLCVTEARYEEAQYTHDL